MRGYRNLWAAACLCALPLFGTEAASAEERMLNLYNVNTKERLSVVYKRDGAYVENALKKLDWFFRDWRRKSPKKMDRGLYDVVWAIHAETGSNSPIHVHSGYRSKTTNSMLRSKSKSVARHSQHIKGKAIDFHIPGVSLTKLREIALKLHGGGVGFYPESNLPFVHVDVGDIRHWPKMTRKQLVRIFPDGMTAHLPADGSPLPRFKEALAAITQRKSDYLAHKAEVAFAAAFPKVVPVPTPRPDTKAEILVAEVSAEAAGSPTEYPPIAFAKPLPDVSAAFDVLLKPTAQKTPAEGTEVEKELLSREMAFAPTVPMQPKFNDLGVGKKGHRLTEEASVTSAAAEPRPLQIDPKPAERNWFWSAIEWLF